MQRTLLMVVQEYLDSTSGFYVNSIFETDESQQVAKIAERVYYRMVQQFPNILFSMKTRALDALNNPDRPNYLLIPSSIKKIQDSKVYYNVSKGENTTLDYKEIPYLTPLAFLSRVSNRTDSSDNSQVVKGFDQELMVILNNQFPSICTSFDGKYIVFDSFNKEYDTTLQASKSKVLSSEEEVFLQQDDFVIPVPDHLSETYLDMFLDEAYTLVYQQPNGMLGARARSARIKLQQDNRSMGQSRAKKNYGRRGFTSLRRHFDGEL